MSFLPEDYKLPSSGGSSNYLKLQDGENRFRILTAIVFGWIDWHDKQPVRYRFNNKPSKPFNADKPIKHFWSMVVWDYEDEAIKIWEVTQKKIMASLKGMSQGDDWGPPYFYDIKVVKAGKELETSYTVVPLPPKALHPQIEDEFRVKPCCLEALFEGEDPWASMVGPPTKGIFSKNDMVSQSSEREGNLFDTLEEKIKEKGVDTSQLAVFLGKRAAEKRRPYVEVIESALHKDFLGSFIGAYKTWNSSNSRVEEIPF